MKKALRTGRASNQNTGVILNLRWLGEPNFRELSFPTNGLWFTRKELYAIGRTCDVQDTRTGLDISYS